MTLLIDGVFFQLNNTGIATLWRSILRQLSADSRFEVYFLDRGNAPKIDSIKYIPFPSYDSEHGAEDSILIQKICDSYQIDVFTSTYYTTPLSTPMILFVYDMIPELFGFDLSHRMWLEKNSAIAYADKFICISESTKNDLLSFFPEIPPNDVTVSHCGLDSSIYYPRSKHEVTIFKEEYSLHKDYFIFVGSREQNKGYKNSSLFYKALKSHRVKDVPFTVLCVGGEKELNSKDISGLPVNIDFKLCSLSEVELSIAYSGALALIYPSLYEGFGLPVVEAMACNCAVVTTSRGSLKEAGGDAAMYIDGTDVDQMIESLNFILEGKSLSSYHNKGIRNAKRFNWADSVEAIYLQYFEISKISDNIKRKNFVERWGTLRRLQADFDIN
jgi:glycosyltransferase involved in cell wall biosynthesis